NTLLRKSRMMRCLWCNDLQADARGTRSTDDDLSVVGTRRDRIPHATVPRSSGLQHQKAGLNSANILSPRANADTSAIFSNRFRNPPKGPPKCELQLSTT